MTARTRFGTPLALAAGLAIAVAADARAQVNCGDTISKGQTVTLTGDVGPCDDNSEDALIVVDSGVLDLGGHTVTCADANADTELPLGIVLTGKKAQLRNGTVVGCRTNVFFGGSGKHRVEGVTARGAARYGFYFDDGSPKNQVLGNVADANGDDGFQIQSDKNKIENNTSQNGQDDGIDVTQGIKNKITGNTATGNSNSGIEATGSKNKIVGNTATNNGSYGIGVGEKKNKVIGNTATNNGLVDIYGTAPCEQNKFKDNTFGSGASCVK
jgi:parallel beta-helix repeat protein